MSEVLRVLDFGLVSAARSQAVYQGIASVMVESDAPVLTLASPETPYVCIGLHQDLAAEVDEAYCRSKNLPVFRRHVGGGAVYLDRDQLFFHFIFPRNQAPKRVTDIYARYTAPVIATYQALGIPARLRPINDIHVGDRKIGGTGAAQIGDATVMVGSFMFDFDIDIMAHCLKVASAKFRDKLHDTLRDYITTIRRELDEIPSREQLLKIFLGEITTHLDIATHQDKPRPHELAAIARWERKLHDPDWLRQPGRRLFAGVKITGGLRLSEGLYKAPGGLIRVHLLSQEDHIADLDINGDFTCLPATGIKQLSKALQGLDLAHDPTQQIHQRMSSLNLDIPGVEAQHLAAALHVAYLSKV